MTKTEAKPKEIISVSEAATRVAEAEVKYQKSKDAHAVAFDAESTAKRELNKARVVLRVATRQQIDEAKR